MMQDLLDLDTLKDNDRLQMASNVAKLRLETENHQPV